MTFLSISTAAAPSYLPAAVTAAGVVLAAMIAGCVALRTHRQSLFIEHVTAERAKWRDDLRDEMAMLAAQIHLALVGNEYDLAAFHAARVGILMRINPLGRKPNAKGAERHALDRIIGMSLTHLSLAMAMKGHVRRADNVAKCVLRQLQHLEHAVQELLKQEWEKSKIEAEKGKLTSPKSQ